MDDDGLEIQDDYSLEDEVIRRMLNEALHNAVDELPQVDREIIILYANKVGTREIAEKVHMPQSTVSYREKIIIKQLRNKLKDWKWSYSHEQPSRPAASFLYLSVVL